MDIRAVDGIDFVLRGLNGAQTLSMRYNGERFIGKADPTFRQNSTGENDRLNTNVFNQGNTELLLFKNVWIRSIRQTRRANRVWTDVEIQVKIDDWEGYNITCLFLPDGW